MTPPLQARYDNADLETCARYDLAHLSSRTEKTPQGFLRAPARFTRVGVFAYRQDGQLIRELRPEEEVFHEDSLATLRAIPVTRGHVAMVDPENASSVMIGHGSDAVAREDQAVAGHLTITTKDAIADAESGKLREISMGYHCKVDPTPGTHPKYGRYDQIQRTIRYNHAALGAIGWGRAGTDIKLRMDSGDARQDASTQLENLVQQQSELMGLDRFELAKKAGLDLFTLEDILGGWGTPKKADLARLAKALDFAVEQLLNLVSRVDGKGLQTVMETITINGVEYEVTKQCAQAYRADQKRQDAASATVKELETKNEALQGRFDAQAEDLKKTKADLTEAQDPKRFDEQVQARADLTDAARKVLGADAEIKGTTREIQEQVLRHDNAELKLEGKSDDYVQARFDQFTSTHREDAADKSKREARNDASNAGANPGGDKPNAEAARAAMLKRNQEAYTKPLSTTQDA